LAVPCALILDPFVIIKQLLDTKSPLINVPGWIVKVAPLVTAIFPISWYTLDADQVVLVVIFALTVTVGVAYVVFAGSKLAHPDVQSVAGVLSVTGKAPK